jgi:hypothetical protein
MDAMQNHPDQFQDMDLIRDRLVPLLEVLATRLEAVEERLNQSEDMITKIVTGFTGAADNHRKGKLTDMIGQQYGEKLGPVKPIYQKLVGGDRDPVADIVAAVMEARQGEGYNSEGEGEYIEIIVVQILDRFGLDSLKKLIEPAVEQATGEGGGSLEIEVSSGPVPVEEEDPMEKMRRAQRRAPKMKF